MHTPIRSWLIVFAAVLATPPVAPAQTFHGFAGGAGGLAGGVIYHSPVVFTGQASIGRRISPRIEIRFDGFADRWDGGPQDVLCLNDALPQECHPPTSVAGFAGNGVVSMTEPAPGLQLYLIGGVGAYYFNLSHGSDDELALGVSGGIGCAVPAGHGSRVILEARYHHMVDSRSWLPDIVPVTLGIQF